MKVTKAQRLLCALISLSIAAARNMPSSTSRYNKYNDEHFYLQNFTRESILSVNAKYIINSSYLHNIHIVNNTGSQNLLATLDLPERSRKLGIKSDKIKVNGMTSSPNYYKLSIKRRNETNSEEAHNYITLSKNNPIRFTNENKNSTIVKKTNSARPKVKYKIQAFKPIRTTTVNPNSSSKKITLQSQFLKRSTITPFLRKKVLIKVKPMNSTTEKIKLLHINNKNYTKLRIKPINKQANKIVRINPEISTYSPEYSINNFSLNSLVNSQSIYPQINPEISTNSPEYVIGGSNENMAQSNTSNQLRIPISQVILQTVPISNSGTKDSFDNDCPSLLISSNVFGPQRQGCSDLNVVINSHFNQNVITETVPDLQPLASDTVAVQAAEPLADAPIDTIAPAASADPVAAADPISAAEPAASAAPAATPTQSTSGVSQGGGLPQLPGLPQLGLPDLKGLFDFLGQIWRILSSIFGFLANPYLYIVPAALSFAFGFLKVMAAFKLFVLIPALLLFGYANKEKPTKVAYYKHIHKPIHHHDAWFWNHNTKAWENIVDYMHSKHIRIPKRR